MWDVFSLLGKAQWSQAPGAHRRPSWAVIAERKKGIKVRSEQQGYTETQWSTEKNKHNVLSADLSLFMSDKHPVVRVSPYARTRRKKTHKSIKDSGPSCLMISVSCALSCFWLHSCLRDGRFVPSSKDDQGNLFNISKVIHIDKNEEF